MGDVRISISTSFTQCTCHDGDEWPFCLILFALQRFKINNQKQKPEDFNMHRGTHICGVSEDDALAVVVTDGFGCHGDRDERPMDF